MTLEKKPWQSPILAVCLLAIGSILLPGTISAQEAESQAEAPAEVDPNDPFANAEWLVEEATGRRYVVEEVPKIEGTYRWMGENLIRLPGGLRVQVVDHDDESFWIKIYEPKQRQPRSAEKKGPSEDEKKEVAESYSAKVEDVDRLVFQPWDQGLPKKGQWRNRFDLADMNGDSHLDIVFGPARKGSAHPNIFLGDGKGTWRAWREVTYPRLPYDYGAAVAGDWNNDGNMDLAFGVHLRGILVLLGDGKGTFEPWTEGIQFDEPGAGGDASSFSSRALMAVDWDEDGKLDILALGEGPKGSRRTLPRRQQRGFSSSRGLVVYLNQGDGTWKPGRIEESGNDFGDDFDLADIDGDDQAEIVLASRIQNNHHLIRRRTEGGMVESLTIDGLRPMIFTTATSAGDLDGDGRDDVLIAYRNRELGVWRTGLDVFYSEEAGWRREILWSSEDITNNVSAMALGNIDGQDGLDLVALTGRSEVRVFLGDGKGFFLRETGAEMPSPIAGCQGFDVHVSDLDGDGLGEILASFAGEPATAIGLQGAEFKGCPGRGRIAVWKPNLAEKAPSAADGAAGR